MPPRAPGVGLRGRPTDDRIEWPRDRDDAPDQAPDPGSDRRTVGVGRVDRGDDPELDALDVAAKRQAAGGSERANLAAEVDHHEICL